MGASSTHWMRRALRGLALAFLLAAALGFTYEQISRWQDSQHRFRIGRAVDIGGRSLNIDCAGSGSPAVILESGGREVHHSLLVRPRRRGMERSRANRT